MIEKIAVAIVYGLVVFLVGAALKSSLHVTEPVVYFLFGTLTAWAAAFAFLRVK
ncbi:hypothetical protein [Ralstonia insidiosa]|jgi:hypothetical protein|nr:hypothetical protein [Ralstonia insidiosa]MBX3905342.1 hypothetical protein [Ralstonia insidiosa]